MSSSGPSPTVRKETAHTVSLVLPHLTPGTSVLDNRHSLVTVR